MAEKIKITGARAERIRDSGSTHLRIETAEIETGLGAEPCGEWHAMLYSALFVADVYRMVRRDEAKADAES